ncbi:hypothetical protein OG985_21695 [Streptomyces sp. NBC_00289]|uniref:hypothetical protein n=1 Tax=Streptomyces sp. NBC_00289 TaxID=2975703 RepID=UPI0032553A69
MTGHALKLDLVDGLGRIDLDGDDIRYSVGRLTLQASHGRRPLLTLEPRMFIQMADVTTVADVTIPKDTRQLLIKLGWTPPAADTE